jgi:hypothetical protein
MNNSNNNKGNGIDRNENNESYNKSSVTDNHGENHLSHQFGNISSKTITNFNNKQNNGAFSNENMESITTNSGSHDASLGRGGQTAHHREQYLSSPNRRGTTNSNTQQNEKAVGRGGGRGVRDRGRGRASNQHYRRASLNTVSKWISDIGNEGTSITSGKENSSTAMMLKK